MHPVLLLGAGKIGTALAQYRGFRQRGFLVSAVYDHDARKKSYSLLAEAFGLAKAA